MKATGRLPRFVDDDGFADDPKKRQRAREHLASQRLDDAYNSFLRRVFAARVAEHPILAGIQTTTTEHAGPVRNVVTGPTPIDTPMVTAVAEGSYAIAGIEMPDFAAHARFVNDVVDQMIGIQLTHMFDAIGKIATAVGHVTEGSGPLTLEYHS